MKNSINITTSVQIPESEIEITASRSGGAGGQHVNKSDTRITLRWNLHTSQALSEEAKHRVSEKLAPELTTQGDLIIHNSSSRSQHQNKQAALKIFAQKIRQALHVPKKRMATAVSRQTKEARLREKRIRSLAKQMRRKWTDE